MVREKRGLHGLREAEAAAGDAAAAARRLQDAERHLGDLQGLHRQLAAGRAQAAPAASASPAPSPRQTDRLADGLEGARAVVCGPRGEISSLQRQWAACGA